MRPFNEMINQLSQMRQRGIFLANANR
jgi:hypothetical protein